MTEITIFGRGGQGGVTLAKLIAQTFFLKGRYAQAFGVYAAERSGAPLQAFVRISEQEITNHNQIRHPNFVIVLDRTLIKPAVAAGMTPGGWILLNTADAPADFSAVFPGRSVATVDATGIAVGQGLGTRTVPIVNTTMLGAVARLFDLKIADAHEALQCLNFKGPNREAAQHAFDVVRVDDLEGTPIEADAPVTPEAVSLLDDGVGQLPRIHTGDWATRRPQRRELVSPCSHACPAGNDVQSFVAAINDGDMAKALDVMLETSPLPGVCGRVCPAPCMDACNRAEFDDAVNIRELERYVADHVPREVTNHPQWRYQHVAVVGSGPAGLSAAYQLCRLGYPVTIFEAGEQLGGLLRTGIPEYRLPRDVLDKEIEFILESGVEKRLGHPVDRAELLEVSREYAAVFVATGLQQARALDLGVDGDTVMQGIDFLDRVNTGLVSVENEDVIVIGGGNTAIDAARSARRLGASSVRLVYRRSREYMPAISEEIDAALEEDVALLECAMPVRLETTEASPQLHLRRTVPSEPDESGRPRFVPCDGDDAAFALTCDRVILALGQSPDLTILPEGSQIRQGEEFLGLAGAPVFFGGDLATNDGTVAAAIGSGRRAAFHVHRTLTGVNLLEPVATDVATPEVMRTHVFAHAPRERGATVPAKVRTSSFDEVHKGLQGADAVRTESGRCFSCGVCNECDRCVTYCPEGILLRDGNGFRFDYDYCKGCGVCASECPRGVIHMVEL